MTTVEAKIMDVRPPKWWHQKMRLAYERKRIRKLFKDFEHRGGVVGNKAVLFCYNDEAPELSYIITEQL